VRYDARPERPGDGETLVLVTDGVIEAVEAAGPAEDRLASSVAQRRTSGPRTVCAWVTPLAGSGRGPQGAGDRADDRTVVAVTFDAT
jgi:hypothetical protein